MLKLVLSLTSISPVHILRIAFVSVPDSFNLALARNSRNTSADDFLCAGFTKNESN